MSHWKDKGLVSRHSSEPRTQGSMIDREPLGPLSHAQRLALECEQAICSLIPPLGLPRSPCNVVGLVSSIHINAFKRVAVWARTYIAEKCSEVIDPLRVHANTACAVVLVPVVFGIVATTASAAPRGVFTSHRQSGVAQAVARGNSSDEQFNVQATTTLTGAGSQTAPPDDRCRAARTTALPQCIPFRCATSSSHNRQATKYLTSQVNRVTHSNRHSTPMSYCMEGKP